MPQDYFLRMMDRMAGAGQDHVGIPLEDCAQVIARNFAANC
jgi:hypothetical protein